MGRYLISLLLMGLPFATTAWGQVPKHDHVFIIVEENQSFDAVIGKDSPMPYLNELAFRYAIAANYYATAHPSIVNYFMLTTGKAIDKKLKLLADNRTRKVTDNNVVRALKKGKKTWRSYTEDIPSAGYIGFAKDKDFPYVKRHNPLSYFEDDFNRSEARNNLVPFSQFSADLKTSDQNGETFANYSFIVPNLFNTAHHVKRADGKATQARCRDRQALKQADDWLRDNIGPLIDSRMFKDNGLLVIVFDEACHSDDRRNDRTDRRGPGDDGGGHVAMLLVGSKVKPGYRSETLYHHEDTLALTLEALGLDRAIFPGAAKDAKSMAEFFMVP